MQRKGHGSRRRKKGGRSVTSVVCSRFGGRWRCRRLVLAFAATERGGRPRAGWKSGGVAYEAPLPRMRRFFGGRRGAISLREKFGPLLNSLLPPPGSSILTISSQSGERERGPGADLFGQSTQQALRHFPSLPPPPPPSFSQLAGRKGRRRRNVRMVFLLFSFFCYVRSSSSASSPLQERRLLLSSASFCAFRGRFF